jgi:hypothetical protein
MVFNAHHETVQFTLPPSYEAQGWKRLFDTTAPKLEASQLDIGAVYEVTARSMLLFERVPEDGWPAGEVRRGPGPRCIGQKRANHSGQRDPPPFFNHVA